MTDFQVQTFRLLELPDLVLDEVISRLPGHTLKDLRLTCKTLDVYATPHLFRVMVVTPHEPHFHHILNTFCTHDGGRLAGHVRTLMFDSRYPAELTKPCFWNKSHLHRFHYDAYVLQRNVGSGREHLIYLLNEFSKILDGVHFPKLRNVIVDDDSVSGPRSLTYGHPIFYTYRFHNLTGRLLDYESRWIFDSDPDCTKFYVTCLLLSVWASRHQIRSVRFIDQRLRDRLQDVTTLDDPGIRTGRDHPCIARDFVSALRSMGFLAGIDDDDFHDQINQTARVGTMLAEVLVR